MNTVLVSLNIGLLGVFYTALGGLVSYVIYYIFEDHSPEWESRSLSYQIFDIVVEITIIGIIAFWITYFIKDYPPLVPMTKSMDSMIDTYTSSLFFTFSMFLFLDDLSKKIRFIYNKLLKKDFDNIFPEGSIFNFFSRKMDGEKKQDKEHQYGL
jgi:hypothetical protein